MIGVLALQGGFAAHRKILDKLAVPNCEVRLPHELNGLSGLIIPGGETTTIVKMIHAFDLAEPLLAFCRSGKPVLGTCAGSILLCDTIIGWDGFRLGVIPATIHRNAYGSQRESFRVEVACEPWNVDKVPGFFIRAPRFEELGEGVAVLCRCEGDITGVTYKNFTAVTFHPELSDDPGFHQAWMVHAGLEQEVRVA